MQLGFSSKRHFGHSSFD